MIKLLNLSAPQLPHLENQNIISVVLEEGPGIHSFSKNSPGDSDGQPALVNGSLASTPVTVVNAGWSRPLRM